MLSKKQLSIGKVCIPLFLLYLVILFKPYKIMQNLATSKPTNNFCQEPEISNLDKSICTYLRFKKIIVIYIDSMPYFIAETLKKAYADQTISFQINNPGIIDSGPVFRNYATGRINYLYYGLLDKIDNIWSQFKNAGLYMTVVGESYPVLDMTSAPGVFSRQFDDVYGLGMGYLSKQFHVSDINEIKVNTNHTDMEILSKTRLETSDKIEEFTKLLSDRSFNRKTLANELQSKLTEFPNWFIYIGNTDVIAHRYSTSRVESQFLYSQQLANVRTLYEEYIQKQSEDTLLVVMSDHGTYDWPYEFELTNHGYQDHTNSAFTFLLSKKFIDKPFQAATEQIHISQFVPTLCMFINNCNIPIFSTHSPNPRFQNSPIEQIIGYRSKEVQLLKYLTDNYDNPSVLGLESPFDRLNKEKEIQDQTILINNDILTDYQNYLVRLQKKYFIYEFELYHLRFYLVMLLMAIGVGCYMCYIVRSKIL